MTQLLILSGPRAGESLDIDREQVIGRGEVDIVIEDPKLSRRHAAVRPVEGGLQVEDLGSLNGTTVDGTRITEPVRLHDGERITLGATTIEIAASPTESDATVLESLPDIDGTIVDRPAAAPPPPPPAPPPPAPPAPGPATAVPEPPTVPEPQAPAPAPAVPQEPAPAPAAQGASAPQTPFGGPAEGPPAPRAATHRHTADSLLWGPTLVCILIIVATAVAIVLYFALRTPPS